MADKEAERIKYATEILRLTWITVLAVGGGTASLLLNDLTDKRLILAGMGISSMLALIVIGWQLDRYICGPIAQLKEML